ncbi:MAG: hypothetical protein LBE92_08055 [Chryseobacterium sp.]|jgi:hypothetical protein|uniref:hypothetical protein n=1 Tax=Chryseobacterium sp. TaxID=1871047 RepID=UPI002835459F|nr:hypothetical protein [Chryseobacterium sp.]MDR2236061.1 hypothetical protein [Chryseobacterium sp.]
MKKRTLNGKKSLSREQLKNITGNGFTDEPMLCHRICCPKVPMGIPPCDDFYCLDVVCPELS